MALSPWDYVAFGLFLAILSLIGYFAGRKERASSEDYFLAGKRLPWYIVGSSFVAANISTEHFIGMVGSACIYGICLAMYEWANVFTFSLFDLAFHSLPVGLPGVYHPRVPRAPLRARHPADFCDHHDRHECHGLLAGPLYGGGLVLHNLFGWDIWNTILGLGLVSGVWASTAGCRRSPGPIPS